MKKKSRIINGRVSVTVLGRISALETYEVALAPSGWNKRGKDEDIKLLGMFLARYQKSRWEFDLKLFC